MDRKEGYLDSRVSYRMMLDEMEAEQRRREIKVASIETYAERKLSDIGFVAVSRSGTTQVVLERNNEQVVFECCCPSFPSIKAMGCPLHHSGPGGSWPVESLKNPK